MSSSFAEVKTQLNIVDVIQRYTKLKQVGPDSYTGLCPFHQEKTPSFRVDASKGVYHCHGCGVGGDVLKFIKDAEHITYAEIPAYLEQQYGIVVPKYNKNENFEKTQQLKVLKLFHETLVADGQAQGVEYLKQRINHYSSESNPYQAFFVSKEASEAFIKDIEGDKNLMAAAEAVGIVHSSKYGGHYSPFANRVVFPLTRYGVIVGFNGRTLSSKETEKKYLLSQTAQVFYKRSYVYGMELAYSVAKEIDAEYVYVTEGIMDTIALLEAKIPAVCVLGARVSTEQFGVLVKQPQFSTVYLTMDGDAAGRKGMETSLMDAFVAGSLPMGFVVGLPDGQDAADFLNAHSHDEFVKLSHQPFEDKVIDGYIRQHKNSLSNPSSLDELKKRVLYAICEHLYDYKSSMLSKSIIVRLSERMAINPNAVFNLIDRMIKAASVSTASELAKSDLKSLSMLVDIADIRLLRLVNSYPTLYEEVIKRDWFNLLNPYTKDLLEIINESNVTDGANVMDLIERKTRGDKKKSSGYLEALIAGSTRLPTGFNAKKELTTLDKVFSIKLNSSRESKLLEQMRRLQVTATGSVYKKAQDIVKSKTRRNEPIPDDNGNVI